MKAICSGIGTVIHTAFHWNAVSLEGLGYKTFIELNVNTSIGCYHATQIHAEPCRQGSEQETFNTKEIIFILKRALAGSSNRQHPATGDMTHFNFANFDYW